MAAHVFDFLSALEIKKVDILGFSMGGHVAPLVYLNGPKGLVQHLVIAGSSPSAGEGILAPTSERAEKVKVNAAAERVELENFQVLFFLDTESSREEAKAWRGRYADGGVGMMSMISGFETFDKPENRAKGSYDRLREVKIPVFIGQGKDDYMIPTVNSFVMQQRLPNGTLKVFPDSGHGFLYQHAEEFAEDVNKFLDAK